MLIERHKNIKGELLFVLLPNKIKNINLTVGNGSEFSILSWQYNDDTSDSKIIPNNYWEILSLLSDITNEQAEEVLPSNIIYISLIDMSLKWVDFLTGAWTFNTALESFNTLKNKLKCWCKNPYDVSLKDAVSHAVEDTYASKLYEANIWREAESRSGNWLVLKSKR